MLGSCATYLGLFRTLSGSLLRLSISKRVVFVIRVLRLSLLRHRRDLLLQLLQRHIIIRTVLRLGGDSAIRSRTRSRQASAGRSSRYCGGRKGDITIGDDILPIRWLGIDGEGNDLARGTTRERDVVVRGEA